MSSKSPLTFKNSIATKLLKTVFSLYVLIAFGVTIGHMIVEYRYQKTSIQKDLKDVQKTFEKGLALDVWQINKRSLQSTIEGMLKIPIIVGVKIQNGDNLNIAVEGIIRQNGIASDVGQHIDLLGLT